MASSTATAAVFLSLNPSAASSPSANTRRGIVLGSFATLSSLSFVCGFARQQLRREQERISLAETNSLLSRCPSQARLREVDLSTREGFLDLFEELCEELAQDAHRYRLPVDASMHLKKLIQYNVPGGKLNRGLTVVHTARTVLGEGVTYAEMKRIAVLGWCIEWVQVRGKLWLLLTLLLCSTSMIRSVYCCACCCICVRRVVACRQRKLVI